MEDIKYEEKSKIIFFELQVNIMNYVKQNTKFMLPFFWLIHWCVKRNISFITQPVFIFLFMPSLRHAMNFTIYLEYSITTIIFLKDILRVGRPLWIVDGMLGPDWVIERTYSTPSAHSTTMTCICIALCYFYPTILTFILCVSLVLLTWLSRMAFSVHYLQDVVLGSLLSIFFFILYYILIF